MAIKCPKHNTDLEFTYLNSGVWGYHCELCAAEQEQALDDAESDALSDTYGG
jgi:hypothetical protein